MNTTTHTHGTIGGVKAWTAAQLAADTRWTFRVGDAEHRDAQRVARWAAEREAPEQRYMRGMVEIPALTALGAELREQMRNGYGVGRVLGFDPSLDDATLRLTYLALGLEVGEALSHYGRLFDVKDRGEDYRTSAVPVSMTRESTSYHTDSSARDVLPDHVALLCLQSALKGGESLVSSAISAHDALSASAPDCLALLYRDYYRDVVTPGTERNFDRIRENRFPVYRYEPSRGTVTFRYMRYWIERAHALLDQPLPGDVIAAFDRLDAALDAPRLVLSFTMRRGEMVWIDNRNLAHNRSAFVDAPGAPRTLVRMWSVDRG
jgi:alpha-ketoglutarate-dependent taurine dioxygenase